MIISLKSISVVIPTLPDSLDIKHCINGLFSMTIPPKEIILVVDGNPEEITFPSFSNIKLYFTYTNKGPAAARNLGVEKATGDYIWFIDSDVLVHHNTSEIILGYLNRFPQISAFIGSYDTSPREKDFLSQYKNLSHHYIHQISDERILTFWTGCGVVKRSAFQNVNGFNTDLFKKPSIEDIELGYRLSQKGYQLLLCKDIQVKHLKKWAFYNLLKTDLFMRAIPWTKILLENKNWENSLNIRWKDRISVVLVFILLSCPLFLFFSQKFWYIFIFTFLLFIFIHWDYYQFFYRHRGTLFSIRVIPNHIFSYLLAGIGFIIGNIEHYSKSRF